MVKTEVVVSVVVSVLTSLAYWLLIFPWLFP